MTAPIPRVGRGGHPAKTKAQAIAMVASGGHFRVVAAHLNLAPTTVYLWCKAAGVKGRSVKGLPPTCHPDRPAYGRRLCRPCYRKFWRIDELPEVK